MSANPFAPWVSAKKILKPGYEKYHYTDDTHIQARLTAIASYYTGLPLYYSVDYENTSMLFETFEEAMIYVAMNNLSIDSEFWATDGLIIAYSIYDEGDTFTLSDGRNITLKSQPID